MQGQEQAAIFSASPCQDEHNCDSNFPMSKPFFYFLVEKYNAMGIVSNLVYLGFEINDDNLVLNQRLFVHFPFNMSAFWYTSFKMEVNFFSWHIGPCRLEGSVTPRSIE